MSRVIIKIWKLDAVESKWVGRAFSPSNMVAVVVVVVGVVAP